MSGSVWMFSDQIDDEEKLHRRQEEINQREQTYTKPKKRSHGIEL